MNACRALAPLAAGCTLYRSWVWKGVVTIIREFGIACGRVFTLVLLMYQILMSVLRTMEDAVRSATTQQAATSVYVSKDSF